MKKLIRIIILTMLILCCGIVLAACNDNEETDIAVTSISIQGDDTIIMNEPKQYTATVLPTNATNKNVVWSIAGGTGTISATGELTATAGTSITIRATSANNIYDETKIYVEPQTPNQIVVSSVSITGASFEMVLDELAQLQFNADVLPNNADDKTITWSIFGINEIGASITSEGIFTAADTGTVQIKATAHNGINDIKTVTVKIPTYTITERSEKFNGLSIYNFSRIDDYGNSILGNTVQLGEDYRFEFEANGIEPIVKINGIVLPPEDIRDLQTVFHDLLYIYRISNICSDVTITVERPPLRITMLDYEATTITKIGWSGDYVDFGSQLRFKITLNDGWMFNRVVAIQDSFLNETIFQGNDGIFTLQYVRSNLTIVIYDLLPHWNKPEYLNSGSTNEVVKNYALRDALIEYIDYYVKDNVSEYFSDLNWQNPETWEIERSNNFKEIFLQAFINDTYSKTLPFNSDYVEKVLSNIYFHFAPGDYNSYYVSTFIFIKTGQRNVPFLSADYLVTTILHEIGHAFCLGESLATLFSFEFGALRRDRTIDDNETYDYVVNGGSARSVWDYGIHFDYPLLKKVGPKDFWQAAFMSQRAYAALWETHFQGISFDDLLFSRMLYRGNNMSPDYADEFLEYIGFSGTWSSIWPYEVANFSKWDNAENRAAFIEFIEKASAFARLKDDSKVVATRGWGE